MIVHHALQLPDKTFGRKAPPGIYRSEESQKIINVHRHMLIGSMSGSWKDILQVFDIGCKVVAKSSSTHQARCLCASESNGTDKGHAVV